MPVNLDELTPFMLDLYNRFNNWKSWSKQEWLDDSCGETIQEFDERMIACEEDLFIDPYGWQEILENFEESDSDDSCGETIQEFIYDWEKAYGIWEESDF